MICTIPIELSSASGVYIIRNTVNDFVYVGATINFGSRYANHFNKLQDGKHENHILQEAVDSLGLECFSFSILEELPADGSCSLRALEQKWIDATPTNFLLNRSLSSAISESAQVLPKLGGTIAKEKRAHPGAQILQTMKGLHITQKSLANAMGSSPVVISETLSGKRTINANFCVALENLGIGDAEMWMLMYNLYLVQEARKGK